MLDSLEGYLDKIAAAANQTAANGGPLAELAASLAISVDTVARQQQEIKRLSEKISALKKKGESATSGATVRGGNNNVCKFFEAVGRTAPHRKNLCYFDLRKMTHGGEGSKVQGRSMTVGDRKNSSTQTS